MNIRKIVSGGQTGVDRAALDSAMKAGIPVGGWCPKGRMAEDGIIDSIYPLRETPASDYAQRTEWNVRDSDATLIIYESEITGGTLLTLKLAEKLGRPVKAVDLLHEQVVAGAPGSSYRGRKHPCFPVPQGQLDRNLFPGLTGVLNVAGPRESQCPGIYQKAYGVLDRLFAE